MATRRELARSGSAKMAFCGVLCALAVTVMLSGGLIPVATYCTPLLSQLLLLPVLEELGTKWGLLSYLAVSLLSLLLGADKEAAFLYLFIGYYPVLKPKFDALPSRLLRLAVKLAFFLLSIGGMYALLCFVLRLDAVLSSFRQDGLWLSLAFFAVLLLCLMLFDFILSRFSLIYWQRIRKRLRFSRK